MTDPDDPSDADLVARCLGADRAAAAFETLYRRHAPCVRAFLRGFLGGGDEHAVADAVQETFLRAYRALPRFDASRPLRPWLTTIAARVALDADERRRRRPLVDHDALAGLAIAWPDARADVRDAVDRLLGEARARVSERKLQAFLLSRAHGLTHAEVAARVGASVATVKRDLEETTRILAGLAVELDLVPARVVTGDAVEAAWTAPADGALTAKQVDAVLREYAAIVAMIRAIEVTPPRTPFDARAINADLVAAMDLDRRSLEESSWATGAVLRATRALVASTPAHRDALDARLARELVEAQDRLARAVEERAACERPADRDALARLCAARAEKLERELAVSASFMAIADAEVAAAGPASEEERAAIQAMQDQTHAMFRGREAVRDAFRRAAADPEHPPTAVRDELAREEAQFRANVTTAQRARAAFERAVAGADAQLAALPATNVTLVRARLPEALDALGPMLFGGEEEHC